MKVFLCALIFPVLLFGGVILTEAQATGSGIVVNKNPNNPQTKNTTTDITKIDFKNFNYPLPSVGNLEKSMTLKNGISLKKDGLPNFTLRKTYYFDLTGDNEDEAITQIIADGCQLGCESSNLFYVHTIENDQPKLIWKIAIGGDVLGGLKAAHFKVKEFVIETFGDCTLNDWLIKTNLDMKKNSRVTATSYSRFVFTYENNSFATGAKTMLPLETNLNMASFRPKISFGEPE
jgi:hypothetical protein